MWRNTIGSVTEIENDNEWRITCRIHGYIETTKSGSRRKILINKHRQCLYEHKLYTPELLQAEILRKVEVYKSKYLEKGFTVVSQVQEPYVFEYYDRGWKEYKQTRPGSIRVRLWLLSPKGYVLPVVAYPNERGIVVRISGYDSTKYEKHRES